MSKQGRRGRGSRTTSVAAGTAEGATQAIESPEAEMAPPEQDAAPSEPEALPGTVELASDELPPAREPADSRDDSSSPPVDLDTHFFDGSNRDSEHEMEHEERDPRMA